MLDCFFQDIESHPALREPASRQRFLDEVRRCSLSAFLPPALRERLDAPRG